MFNLVSKVLFLFIDPPALILVLLIVAWMTRKRRPRLFQGIMTVAILLLYLLACPKTSQWLVSTLEGQYRDSGVVGVPGAQAIVVLGGSLKMPNGSHPLVGITNSSDRMLEALRLYRAGKAPIVVLSGGDNPLLAKDRNLHEADEMRAILNEWGVPDSAILVENGSINTRENALFTYRLLEPRSIQRVILVTSAIHMPRAASTFRRAGFEVVPVPADFLTGWEKRFSLFDWFPSSGALMNSKDAMHEWLGLCVYRMRGWS
jgi:uncharacterized SAM-binding protein YcdF (DUF218 family)